MRKDMKKSSYYVWFLGAQEAKGLRGVEYLLPVVRSLVEREREVEPFKVTLQVSHKGLKIVQNVPTPGQGGAGGNKQVGKPPKTETVKHFIPHHAVTCVQQQDDIVACILLLYNPVTKCPVHVHAYRCDSVETAQILYGQLQTLIDRPDNQKKLSEIESRLRAKGLLPSPSARIASGGSDGRSTSTRESESSGGSSSERLSGLGVERMANLYDSLAAELREKLGADPKSRGTHAPLLLPPRDYDTVHRQKGNLASVDRRRCLNANIVGINAKNVMNLTEENTPTTTSAATGNGTGSGMRQGVAPPVGQTGRAAVVGSSGGSSGIGSDHAPSPDNESDPRYLDNASSSDEDWNDEPSEGSLFLVQPARGNGIGVGGGGGGGGGGVPNSLSCWRVAGSRELSLPRARRVHSSGMDSPVPVASPSPTSPGSGPTPTPNSLPRSGEPAPRRSRGSPTENDAYNRHMLREDEEDFRGRVRSRRPAPGDRNRSSPHRSPSPLQHRGPTTRGRSPPSPRGFSPPTQQHRRTPSSLSGPLSPRERFQDAKEKFLSLERERLEEQERMLQKKRAAALQNTQIVEPPISPAVVAGPRPRPRRPSWSRSRDSDDADDVLEPRYADHPEDDDFSGNVPTGGRQRIIAAVNRRMSRESLDDDGEDYPPRQTARPPRADGYPPYRRDPERPESLRSRHDYRDARYARDSQAVSRSRSVHREDRFRSPPRGYLSPTRRREESSPRPGPRAMYPEEENPRFRPPGPPHHAAYNDDMDIPLERYRNNNPRPAPRQSLSREDDESPNETSRCPYVPEKRRSAFEILEEERRRHSNELAQELKRRSYQDSSPGYQELDERERYPGLDRETARIHHHKEQPVSPRYRHSYAEPPPLHHELLHRANSSVSSPRVGIAAVHPY